MKKKNLENELLEFIKTQVNNDNEVVPLSLIASTRDLNLRSSQRIKALISLVMDGDIETVTKRRVREELFFSLVSVEKGSGLMCSRNAIEQMVSAVDLYSNWTRLQKLSSFHKLTSNKFKKMAIFEFLERCDADWIDLNILCKYLEKFFADEGPISIMDLGLSKSQIVDVVDRIHKGNFLLQNQGIIEVTKERGGIYLNGLPTIRLIDLLKGERISVVLNDEKKGKGLYFELKCVNIKERPLFYNKEEGELFRMASALLSKEREREDISLSILLYGLPGTGKTEFAYQLAREVEADIMQLNFSEIQSKWIGETEKNIRLVFGQYDKKRKASRRPIILLINEADGLMNKRVVVSASNDAFHNYAQTQLLELLEEFKGIVIVTTNLYRNIDEAFHRRFLFRKEISMPNRQTRELILRNSTIREHLNNEVFEKLLEAEWSPAQIRNIEQKIKQLATIQTIDERLVESLFIQDEMLQKRPALGFVQNNRFSILSKSMTESSQCV